MTLAGIRRYAAARGWTVGALPSDESRPEDVPSLLAAHHPVVGCVVDCSDDSVSLPPRLFGAVPVVYLHPPPSLRRYRATFVATDNEAVARAAFRELSAARPPLFAVAGVIEGLSWSRERERTFVALAAKAAIECRVFGTRSETKEARASRLAEWVATLPRHTAVFAVNDFVAADVVEAAAAAHRGIPRDLTLLGVDNNTEICESSHPTVSSIEIDHERAGHVAARLLAARVKTEAPCEVLPSLLGAAATIGPLLVVRRESTGGSGRREPYITKAVEIIRREACEGLTAAGLASRMPGSRRLLEMRFREAMGHSILDEIMHVRMEKVETLLSDTDTSIGAIADFCGFGSEVELRQLFRARTGMSMREWRKRNRQ